MKKAYKCENCYSIWDEFEADLNIYHCDKCGKEICYSCSLDNLDTGEVLCHECVSKSLNKVIIELLDELTIVVKGNIIAEEKLNVLKEKVGFLMKN